MITKDLTVNQRLLLNIAIAMIPPIFFILAPLVNFKKSYAKFSLIIVRFRRPLLP